MLGAIRPDGSGGGGGAVASVFGRTGSVVAASGDYSVSQIGGLGASAAPLLLTPAASQTLTAASSITPNGAIKPITAASAITLTSNPQITAGTNGQRIEIVNVGSNAITFATGNGLLIPQSFPLYPGRSVGFVYSSTFSSWILSGVIPESLAITGAPTAPTAGLNTNSTQLATTAYVNQSNRPYCAANRIVTGSSIAHGAFTRVVYNNELSDLNGIHNPSTGVITIPSGAAGLYQFSASVLLDAFCATIVLSLCNANTGAEIRRIGQSASASDVELITTGTIVAALNSGDQVDIRCYQANGGSAARNVTGDSRYSFLAVHRLNI